MSNQSRMNGGRHHVTHDRVRGVLRRLGIVWLRFYIHIDELRDHANSFVAHPNLTSIAVGLKLGVQLLQLTPRTQDAPPTHKSVAEPVSRTWTCAVASEGHIEDLRMHGRSLEGSGI